MTRGAPGRQRTRIDSADVNAVVFAAGRQVHGIMRKAQGSDREFQVVMRPEADEVLRVPQAHDGVGATSREVPVAGRERNAIALASVRFERVNQIEFDRWWVTARDDSMDLRQR